MTAQIIRMSDHRKVRPLPAQRLMSLPLSMFVAYLVVGAAIHEVIMEAAQALMRAPLDAVQHSWGATSAGPASPAALWNASSPH